MHKETECTSFAKKFLQIICIQHVKRNLHIFLNYTPGHLIYKMYILSFFGHFFCKHFHFIIGFCQKKMSNFANLHFFQILIVVHKSVSIGIWLKIEVILLE